MMWILIAGGALLVGIMMFSKMQSDLPDNVKDILHVKSDRFNTTKSTAPETPLPSATSVGSSANKWSFRSDGSNVEAIRDLTGSLTLNGVRYDSPSVGLTCYDGQLYVRLDTKLATKGPATGSTVLVNGKAQQWQRGQALQLYSPAPRETLKVLSSKESVTFGLEFQEAGAQSYVLETAGIRSVLKNMPEACRG